MIPGIGYIGSPLTKYLVGIIGVLVVVGGSYYKGRVDGNLIAEARVNEQHRKEKEFFSNELARIQKEIHAIVNDIVVERREWNDKVTELQASLAQTTEQVFKNYLKGVTVTKEVIRYVKNPNTGVIYVPSPSNQSCVVNNGFVDLHNKAAAGAPIEEVNKGPSPATVNEDSKKKLSDVATVVASNYYTYEQVRQQLIALQTIIRDYQKKQKELSDQIAKEEKELKSKGGGK